jgi:soluble lytic murein transglycosylase-like protein
MTAWLAGIGISQAADAPEAVRTVSSVVRPDPRSGRLVRQVVVSRRSGPARGGAPVFSGASAREPFAQREANVGRFIDSTARRYDVDPLLVHSVIQVESNYNPFAVSPKGAQGLMQLMPATARRFNVRDTFNPRQNIEGGVRYLRHLLTLFSDPTLAVAAYNAGEGAVFRYGNVPPYRETSEYVHKVARKLGEARKAEGKKPRSAEPTYPPIRQFVDERGTVYLQTLRTGSLP